MAQVTHTGNGDVSNTNNLGYSFTFPALSASEVQVSVNNVGKTITTDYTIQNFSQSGSSNAYVLFTSTTARGTGTVRIFRQTDGNNLEHTFQSGSAIKADDLNKSNQQVLYLAEEAREAVNNLALGSSGSAVQINGSNISNNSITSEKITDLEVKTSDINNLAVTTDKVADDAITTDKLANSINTTIAGKANTGANLSTFTNDSQFITLAQAFSTGMIMMFTGTTAPSGWVICDNSTAAQNANAPDLRDRFVIGVGTDNNIDATGGTKENTLAITNLPSHTHTFSGSNTHNHDLKTVTMNDNNSSFHPAAFGQNNPTYYNTTTTGGGTTGVQNETISISGTTSAIGSGTAVENRPPFYALCFIMKL